MNDSLLDILERLNFLRAEIKLLNEELNNKETELVGLVKQQSDLKEEERIAESRKVIKEVRQRDLDIKSFQENYPLLCNMAKKRDVEQDFNGDSVHTEYVPSTNK